ncbi:hypothetical protein OSTOST_15003, partial [Ostertagia ostertagi]
MLLVITALSSLLVNSFVNPPYQGCEPPSEIKYKFQHFWMTANPYLLWDEYLRRKVFLFLLGRIHKVNGTFAERVGRNFWTRPNPTVKEKVFETMHLFQRWQVAGLPPHSKYGCNCVYYPAKDIMEMACFFQGDPDF